MYRSKKDVDKHVEGLIAKLSLKEFKSRAYSIARLYFEVADYASCQRYVEQYMSLKDNNAAAHKLLGQALQKLGHKEKALEQYKTSLDLDPTQTSLILEICELLADDEVLIDPGRARYWCEKAEATFPKHPTTFRLREKLMASNNQDPEALISLLTSEIAVRPKDPTLHARLLKHYLKCNKIKEAFDHSCDVEFGSNTFLNNCAWYETLVEILKHNSLNSKDWLYQLLSLTVRERLCVLSLSETHGGSPKSLLECSDILHHYDQELENISKAGTPPGFAEFHAGLLQHHRGQFCLYAATLVLKKAKKDQLSWRDAKKVAAPFMLMAWHAIPLDVKVSWLTHAPQKIQTSVHRWYIEGSFRCSQAGHYLLSNVQDKSQSFLDLIAQSCSGKHWRDKLYEQVFTNRDHLAKIKSSHFATEAFHSPTIRLPRKIEVEAYDIDAQKQYPNSLHFFVWTIMNYKNYAHYQCNVFDMFTPKTRNYLNSGPETLNKLDILAFLYSAVLTAQQQKQNQNSYISPDKPKVLPAIITDLLCPLFQMKWWDCAYKFSQNQLGSELSDIRTTLSRGIEVIRCVDNHGLDAHLLYSLGHIFSVLAKNSKSADEKNNLEARAVLYYSTAIPLLEKIKSKIVIKVPEKRMFDYTHKELSNKEINALIEECKMFVAVNYLNEADYERALEILSNLKSPQAYFHISETYKRMALEEQNISKDMTNNETKTKYATLLGKARNYAYATLDQLKETTENTKHPLYLETQELLEVIESKINKLGQDVSGIINDVDGKYSSDETVSSGGSEHVPLHTNSRILRNLSSTPKQPSISNNSNYRTAVDSHVFETSRADHKYLERIENQIKNLQKRDATIDAFMNQTKYWFEENRNLGNQIMSTINSNIQSTTDQFKMLKISVDQVKDQIDECRNECKDVGELKKQISELKKEVNKLKKSSSEQTIDENDLYNLEDDLRTNESISNFPSQLPFTPPVIPPFNQRLVPSFPVPPNPYQLYSQNLYNLYNQYSQFAQGAPAAGGLFDSARAQVNYPGVFPIPEQMYPDVAHLIPPAVPSGSTMTAAPPMPSTVPHPMTAPKPPVQVSTAQVSIAQASTAQSKDSLRTLPVNVVITSSDPLPTCTTAPQPVLSVTIPPKHIKGTPHNYQIAMPATCDAQVLPSTIFSTGILGGTTTSKPVISWNQNTVFKTTPGVNTSSDNATFSLFGSPKTKLFDNSISVVDGHLSSSSPNTSLNKSRTMSERSNTSIENYDPCPDFKPIVPLPAEVKVTTGEEDETALFCARSKLFRFVDNQWKERGIGEIKLLKHKVSGKVRVLMRREQVHKICANHLITPEMEIRPMKNETKAYFWAANDFAEESLVFEKFCIRFKTPEIANKFYETFEKARKEAKSSPQKPKTIETVISKHNAESLDINKADAEKTVTKSNKTEIGGFTFSSTPTFKPLKEDQPVVKTEETVATKANPFSALSFKSTTGSPFSNLFSVTNQITNVASSSSTKQDTPSKLNTSDNVEEFEPTTEFKPVVPLPALIETKTGEEEETVLFEHRAKLLRFDSSLKEWKERGLGSVKILAQKKDNQKIRILMRREQVMKVCCNHAITKDLSFTKMPNVEKAVTWCAKDFSEGELVAETFCLRFKTVDACDKFMAAIKSAQASLKDDSRTIKEEQNAVTQSSSVGFGDKFKPKAGSWSCEACYTNNLDTFSKCACCEQPRPQTAKLESAPTAPTGTLNWGDKFKPKAGTWECKECYIRNEANLEYCSACNSPQDPSLGKKEVKPAITATPKFSFGIPTQTGVIPSQTSSPLAGFGDKFKPKEGSWECKHCLVRNDGNLEHCSACTSPRNPEGAVKKESKSIFDSVASGPKFSFGIPSSVATSETSNNKETPKAHPTSIFDGTGKFSFGIPSNAQDKSSNIFGNTGATSIIFATPKKPENQTENPLNLILKKNDELSVTVTPAKPALLPTPQTDKSDNKDSVKFGFVFKPKSPMKGKSPEKKGEESDDNEYASEDEGHHLHFSPVVPLPDKVEVVTGEENEDELYGHRAKLFRFVGVEWKERGLGVVKILKHKDTGKLRVVMRREQVLKICLNHALTPDIIYTAKDEKTWLFAANDFSEGKLNLQQFCLRFKTKEIASEFKDAIDKSLQSKPISNEDNQSKPIIEEDNQNDDVIFVSQILCTPEEKQRAKELMLPENFFNYKNSKPCPGCRGCKSDDEETPEPSTTSLSTTFATPLKNTNQSFFSPGNSVYGTPTNSNKTADNSVFQTPMQSMGSESTPLFGNRTNKNDKENSMFAVKSSIFGELPPKDKTDLNQNDTLTPSTTKISSIFAPPKLGNLNILKESQSVEPKNVFGNMSDQKSSTPATSNENRSIFSMVSSSSDKKPHFGFGSPNGNKSIFGNPASDSQSIFGQPGSLDNKSIFRNAVTATNKPIVGTKNEDESKPEIKSIFGSDSDQKPVNLFSSAVQSSLFGPGSTNNNQSKPFGGGLLGSNGGSFFGNNNTNNSGVTAKDTVEQKKDDKPSIFGGKTEVAKIESAEVKKDIPFQIEDNLSFASLSSGGPGFVVQKSNNFKWEGAGQQLFGQKARDKKNKDDSGAGDGGEAVGTTGDEEYDPHYEPIVPLPDEIVVTTGEEDEEKLYGERAKLYRYDDKTKEWKERGVGELKILYHPQRNTYRLLLRREQVHKAVLNMLVFMDLELLPLKNSDRAWTWAGINHAEGGVGEHETLAVRFKSVDLAAAFHDKVIQCVRKLQAAAAQAIREEKRPEEQPVPRLRLPKNIDTSARADAEITSTAQPQDSGNGHDDSAETTPRMHFQEPGEDDQADDEEDYEGNYEDYENYYNEEDESPVYFVCNAEAVIKEGEYQMSCVEAQAQVMLDHEIYAPKILITDAPTGEILADTMIHAETEFKLEGETCSWSGIDYTTNEPAEKDVTLRFADIETAMQFYECCESNKATTYSSTDPES